MCLAEGSLLPCGEPLLTSDQGRETRLRHLAPLGSEQLVVVGFSLDRKKNSCAILQILGAQ